MPNAPQIPPPDVRLSTPGGWHAWWRWWHRVALTTDETTVIASGPSRFGGLAEGEIADLQNRVRNLEGRLQFLPDQPVSKTELRGLLDSLQQAIEAVERLIPTPNPGVFNNLTVTLSGGLTFQGQINDAGVATATFTNAKHAGNPVFYLPIVVNGVAGVVPVLAA